MRPGRDLARAAPLRSATLQRAGAALGVAVGYVPALQMRIGVPKETAAGEHRVALVPEVVSKLRAKGLEVLVQQGAGSDALVPDAAYVEAGAKLTGDASEVWTADVGVTIAPDR